MKRKYILGFLAILSFVHSNGNEILKQLNVKFPNNKIDSSRLTERLTIQNNYLTVEISKLGAELTSIRSATMEYLWQADPNVWPKHSPLLFPIVGALNDKMYTYERSTYSMQRHGFASDVTFEVVERSTDYITLEYTATAETKTNYPFDFKLQVLYRLHKNKVLVRYTVKNTMDTEPLPFSIGAHPAFKVPFKPGQERNDYALVFHRDLSPKTKLKKNGRYVNEYRTIFKRPGILSLSDSLFNDGALAFEHNPFTKVSFVHIPTNKIYLSIKFRKFPYLGIWSVNDTANFVCIEPWHGIGDNAGHNGDLKQKEGIITLEPGKTFRCQFTVETY